MITLAIIYILVAVSGSAIGQIMLKQGMNQFGAVTLSVGQLPSLLLRLATNPWVLGGLALYACGTVFWVAALSRVDLSYAYPFASLSYVLMLLASWQLLDETVTLPRIVGTTIIALGVIVVSRG